MEEKVEIKHGMCGTCTNHCGVAATVRDGEILSYDSEAVLKPGTPKRWVTTVRGCPRRNAIHDWFYSPTRLNYPLKRAGERGEGKWKQIGWDQAFDEIAEKLTTIKNKYGPESIAISTTGDNFSNQMFRSRFQHLLGSPNGLSMSTICVVEIWPMSAMLSGEIICPPILKPETRCTLIAGANLSVAWRPIWYAVLESLAAGGKLIVIDPNRTEAAARADIWLQPRPGTDAALLLSMINVIIEEGLYDREFVEKWSYGFDKLAERAREYPPEKVAGITWVPAEKIRDAARLYATNKPGVTFNGMGLELAPNHMQSIWARLLLPALTGNLDVRGGDRFQGHDPRICPRIAETELIEKLSPAQRKKMLGGDKYKLFSWEAYDIISESVKKVRKSPIPTYWFTNIANAQVAYRAMIDGKPYPVRALITEGQNSLLSMGNAKLIHKALKNLDLHVVHEIVMTPTGQLADYVLPGAAWPEKPAFMGGDYASPVQGREPLVPSFIEGKWDRRAEFYLYRELGVRMGQAEYWPWKTLEEALNYEVEPLGLTWSEFAKLGVSMLPQSYKRYEAKGFGTPTGKFEFYCTTLEKLGYDPLPRYIEPPESPVSTPELAKEYPLILIGRRSLRYHHTEGRDVKAFRDKEPDPFIEINPAKARELGIEDGDWVCIETPVGKVTHRAKYSESLNPNVVSTGTFGWWYPEEPGAEPSLHGAWRSNINVLFDVGPKFLDPISGGWPYRGLLCKVYKENGEKPV